MIQSRACTCADNHSATGYRGLCHDHHLGASQQSTLSRQSVSALFPSA